MSSNVFGYVVVNYLLVIFILSAQILSIDGLFKMTNVQCESLNKSVVVINQCRLRAVSRDIAKLYFNVTLQYPAHNIHVNFNVAKKANGYKPFPINVTSDICKFMRKPNHPFIKLCFKLFKEYTNMNHTCPYEGHLVVDGFYPKHELLDLPLPNGEYAIYLTWYMNTMKVFVTKVYWAFQTK